ncbi:TPA: hypothetical protein ACH3X3_012481 [Trebouxia sp. C0006]
MTLLSMTLPCNTGNAAVSRMAVTHMLPTPQITPLSNLLTHHQLHVFSHVRSFYHCGASSKRSLTCQGLLHKAAASSSIRSQNPAKLAVFVSGGGSNFRAIHDAILSGHIHAQIAVVVSDAPGCGAWAYARQAGIPTICYPHSTRPYLDMPADAPPPLDTPNLIHMLKQQLGVDFVILAGYLKLVPAALVREYKDAMLNIHPGLLPAFGGKGLYGLRVHKAVIASGARFSGATVHFVDEEYDTGPILAQAVVPVNPHDTPQMLAARVLQQEHRLYPTAVAALAEGRITWREDGIPIMWTPH